MELWYTEEQTEHVRLSMKVKKHLYSKKSPFQQIDVLDTYEFGKLLTIDGLVMVTEKDEFIYHDMITHVPMATNPNIKKVLVIGAGDGGTVRELTRYKTIEKIDMVEIDEVVVAASREHFDITACRLDDPRVNLYFEDGIKFVEGKESVYDLIIVDSTDPIGPGEGLFTTEFYKNCYKTLTEEGILVNQNESPYYEEDAQEMIRASRKIKDIFPIAEVYQAHIPTYPSGHWLFGFASKKLHPVKDLDEKKWNDLGLKTKYYNTQLHVGSFALPNYVKEMIETGTI
ncbi:polyamine aminopropyltransferase [Marinisporobacter balticus]|uniref:Polyamine aminopropyltransferase n=1 Tax=Marinisporobacter balticus TaxID=2018667 RepID=A0A4R2KP78_9FIRM|nr:polyamine aminopropyltransferase [Marinisporobacter balticus]TCO74552.1 spermidine synthase [Marinisporobacter balticus]